ncbi:MAG: SDR family oxidoreductase [Nocardioides sp.]
MSASRDLSSLTVLVTGGARGIGLATAERLSRHGARVAIGDRDADLAAEAAARLSDGGARVVSAPLDVTDPASWRSFLDAVSGLGPVDVLVNNAGVMPLGPVLQEPDEVTRTIVDVNLHGVINGTKAVVPGMVERGRGQVVNVASAVGRVAVADGATYSASKFAVVGFTEATRAELAPYGVEVGMVLPTVVRTELATGVDAARGVRAVTAEEVAEVVEAMVLHPRPEMWVPRWTQGLTRMTGLLPRRAQDAVAHAFGADRVLAQADHTARAAYEARARRASPSAARSGSGD